MAELVFFSGTMDCGKSTLARATAHAAALSPDVLPLDLGDRPVRSPSMAQSAPAS